MGGYLNVNGDKHIVSIFDCCDCNPRLTRPFSILEGISPNSHRYARDGHFSTHNKFTQQPTQIISKVAYPAFLKAD